MVYFIYYSAVESVIAGPETRCRCKVATLGAGNDHKVLNSTLHEFSTGMQLLCI